MNDNPLSAYKSVNQFYCKLQADNILQQTLHQLHQICSTSSKMYFDDPGILQSSCTELPLNIMTRPVRTHSLRIYRSDIFREKFSLKCKFFFSFAKLTEISFSFQLAICISWSEYIDDIQNKIIHSMRTSECVYSVFRL